MTDATAAKVHHLLFKALVGHDLTGAQMVIEEIVRIERCAVLKEAIDRMEKADEGGPWTELLTLLEEEEKK